MGKERIKAAGIGVQEMNEAMRKVRKEVVTSIMTSTPRMSAAKWLSEKDSRTGTQK